MSLEERIRKQGHVFGSWEVRERIGSGSGGRTVVFRIVREHSDWQEENALKAVSIFEEPFLSDGQSMESSEARDSRLKDLLERAEKEVRVMNELKSGPHIVRFFDHEFREWRSNDRSGCDLLIRMDLQRCIDSERNYFMQSKNACSLGRDICTALIACHEMGIVHRDIKSSPKIFFTMLRRAFCWGISESRSY